MIIEDTVELRWLVLEGYAQLCYRKIAPPEFNSISEKNHVLGKDSFITT
jgi:hypothetical protein